MRGGREERWVQRTFDLEQNAQTAVTARKRPQQAIEAGDVATAASIEKR